MWYNCFNGGTMKDEIKNRVLLDLFATPSTMVPFFGGLTMLILAWVMGWGIMLGASVISTCLGVGIFLTKFIFGLDKITQAAYQYEIDKKEQQLNKELDELDSKLRQDRDPRPENCLRRLRVLNKKVRDRLKINPVGSELIENFDRLFQICISKIKETDEMWRDSRNLGDSTKKKVMREREKIVEEIEDVTSQLDHTVEQFQVIEIKKNDGEISELRKELEQTLLVAKKTEERLANLNSKSYDPKEFE